MIKKINITLFILLIISVLCYFTVIQGKSETKVDISLSIAKAYENIDELANDSEVIAQVIIRETSPMTYLDVPFTISEADVKKTYKGTVLDKSIQILETGGLINNIQFSANGHEVFRNNEQAVVFLKKYEGPIGENLYMIAGIYQGKFKLDNDTNSTINPINNAGNMKLELSELENQINENSTTK
ncbi:hypothetical protein [Paenibacillus sp. NPDC093718]|uniref:hypothetical protein n=1 Tax=Paenibacillus sp. NPDC093718 TaxID=3390601 RepID=UPI003D08FB8E